jgi:hypothetical protein
MKHVVGSALAVGLVIGAAASGARAEDSIDVAGGSVYVTSRGGAETISADYYVRTSAGAWLGLEVVAQTANPQDIRNVSHSTGGVALHSGPGDFGPLTTSLFRSGAAAAPNPPFVLRDAQAGTTLPPASVRTITLDPGEPAGSSVLLDASHVLLPRTGQLRALALVQRGSGEAVLLDYDFAAGPVRRTPLGFTPPIGTDKGSFVGSPDGRVWAGFASTSGIRLFDLGDLSLTGPLQPKQVGAFAVGGAFDPRSTQLGIIAILIGLLAQPVPSISYQAGDELFLSAFDGSGFRPVAQQSIPSGASGLLQDDGSYYFLLPYLEQDNLWRGLVGSPAEPVLPIGD